MNYGLQLKKTQTCDMPLMSVYGQTPFNSPHILRCYHFLLDPVPLRNILRFNKALLLNIFPRFSFPHFPPHPSSVIPGITPPPGSRPPPVSSRDLSFNCPIITIIHFEAQNFTPFTVSKAVCLAFFALCILLFNTQSLKMSSCVALPICNFCRTNHRLCLFRITFGLDIHRSHEGTQL